MIKKIEGVPKSTLPIKHPHHEKHLCVLATKHKIDEIAKLAKNPKFICKICGRVAAKAGSLCEPIDMP
jgi:hypothetical protein